MSIQQLFLDNVGSVGMRPQNWKLISNDETGIINTAGYLNSMSVSSEAMQGDFIEVITGDGSIYLGYLSISGGLITINPMTPI